MCKAVIVCSWPRRKDATISLDSAAEAWAKAWYSDIILGITKLGQTRGGNHRVKLNVVKNRFGQSDTDTIFEYNYQTLKWNYAGAMNKVEEDW